MNYRVTHAPIWNTSNIQRGVVVADTAEQARQIFVVSGCEVLEVEELHLVEEATRLEAQYEKPQADEADWFTKPDSLNVSESWQADAIAEAEFDADSKWTQECAR